jgi:hypothetical protein
MPKTISYLSALLLMISLNARSGTPFGAEEDMNFGSRGYELPFENRLGNQKKPMAELKKLEVARPIGTLIVLPKKAVKQLYQKIEFAD